MPLIRLFLSASMCSNMSFPLASHFPALTAHNALGSCTKPDGEKIEIQADYNVIDEGFIIVRIFDRALHDTHPYRSRVSAATIPSNHMSFVMVRMIHYSNRFIDDLIFMVYSFQSSIGVYLIFICTTYSQSPP